MQCGIMVPRSAGVAARKEPLNHDVQINFQRNRHGIMVPRSAGVAAREEA